MSPIIHRADERGISELGWLSSRFSFSFADYHNRERMGFGVLRVINDDRVQAGTGFGMHQHRDMEIVTLVTKGALEHRDSEENHGIIHAGEIQYMSAGTGIYHSEHATDTEDTELFQIWIHPDKQGYAPRYEQRDFRSLTNTKGWHTLVSGDGRDHSIQIRQSAQISIASLENGEKLETPKMEKNRGLLLLVIEGQITIDGTVLNRRDEIQITQEGTYTIEALQNSQVLLFDISISER
ncbi:MAG: pirin family protein [Sulfuricurvum sp.]|uniref:pirin family protein n=1 Tax=Sulfuricurvum sp. TaxID=2025608 RepID=UPI002735478F|nr:pirin family protein [Sulfuricurvum sp.]MDP2850238.1 pirin family protein [Sulfuricurvum sp.]